MQNQYTSIETETDEVDTANNPAKQHSALNTPYEKILNDIKLSLLEKIQVDYPDFSNLSESDPMSKTIEIAAYRELLVRQKITDTIKKSLLSQSTGNELNQLAQLVLDENKKVQNSAEIKTAISTLWNDTLYYTTGTKSAYQHFVMQFGNGAIRDVNVVNENHAVTIYILFHDENIPSDIDKFKNELQKKIEDENIRRITDKIEIQVAKKITYTIKAELMIYANYSSETIEALITEEIEREMDKGVLGGLNKTISTNSLFKLFYKNGVKAVALALVKLPETTADNASEDKDKLEAGNNETLCWNKKIEFTTNTENN